MADFSSAISHSQARELSPSDSDNSDYPNLAVTPGGNKPLSKHKSATKCDGSGSSESAKKARGRPPGSKNKPKPPIVITKDNDSAMKPVFLEITAGSDVVETLIHFARKFRVGITVINGTGSVSNVTFRHPLSNGQAISLPGPFNILSLCGSFLGYTTPSSSSSTNSKPNLSFSCSFGITLAGAQGQIFGGIIAGKVTAATQVFVLAATFLNPTFHKLPSEADEEEETKPNVNTTSSCTSTAVMPISPYSSVAAPTPLNVQISSDVMTWNPSSRPPY